MLRQMERSTIQVMAKRGKSIRQIANELGRSPTTIARVLHEPVDKPSTPRQRVSKADPYRPQIEAGIKTGLSTVRILEIVREDRDHPYRGGRTVFGDLVRRVRRELAHAQAITEVPMRFEGLPAEYLQVDWGEIRHFPFSQQPAATRYFLACRLKYSRWSWVRFTCDMRQETLFRGLVDGFRTLGWIPWVLVFDNMKTVTTGRDVMGQPLWTPALQQFAAEFGFHPQACDPGAANQKGSVESLVKWVKGNFLAGRPFTEDADLAAQTTDWLHQVNHRPSDATGVPPMVRVLDEVTRGGRLPVTAQDFGLLTSGYVSREALVAVAGNRYSVPVKHVGAPVTIRLHEDRVRLWRDALLVADHPRAPDGARQRVIDPAHFAPLFSSKPRAQVMLYREVLLALGGRAPAFLSELSRRQPDQLRREMLALYQLYEQVGTETVLAAMAQADDAGTYSAAAVILLATDSARPTPVPALPVLQLPVQSAVDRALSSYEAWVVVDEEIVG